MAKDLRITLLLDYYGNLLTEKQREVVELYYNEDLSLAEISEHTHITRQGVRDSIKRGEAILLEAEEKLCVVGRFSRLEENRKMAVHLAEEIVLLNNKRLFSGELKEKLNSLLGLLAPEQE